MSNPNILYEIVLKIKKYMDYSIRTGKKRILRPNFYLIYFY